MRVVSGAVLLACLIGSGAFAAEPVRLVLKDNRFTPSEVRVQAGERFRIEVQNDDPTVAEFESSDLKVEKVVAAGGKITVSAGPLKPGTYAFFDEYHPETAKGTLVAVPTLAEK